MAQFPDEEVQALARAGKLPVIDWTRPAQEIVAAGPGVAYWRGTKWLLRPAAIAERKESPGPGRVAALVNGPVTVGAADACIVTEDYAVEGSTHEWLMPGRFADACARIGTTAGLFVFEPQRYHTFDNILHRFSAVLALQNRWRTGDRSAYLRERDLLYWRNREFLTALLRDSGIRPGGRFLDIGCSSYPWAAAIADDFGMEAWGCDLFPREYFEPIDWFHYLEVDVGSFPELPAQFDFVWCRGLTPLCYTRTFDCEPVRRLRDNIVRALSPEGTIYFVIYGSGTGRPRNEDDWGCVTGRQMAEFWGGPFRHVTVEKSSYLAVRASNRPFADPACSDEGLPPGVWEQFRTLHATRRELVHAMLKISNRIWPLVGFEPAQREHVSGTGELAEVMNTVLREVHGYLPQISVGPEVKAGTTFVFQMTGGEYEGDVPHYAVTLRELIDLIARRRFWCVDGDHDVSTVIRVESRLPQNPVPA